MISSRIGELLGGNSSHQGLSNAQHIKEVCHAGESFEFAVPGPLSGSKLRKAAAPIIDYSENFMS